jgi:glycosyltransferase involved in cell wall biosynthesis
VRSADITFVIITKNEAANIAACLQTLPSESPVLVYDAISTDATVDIARARGAAVVQAPWAGYLQSREDAAVHVTTAWTFMLDADERMTPSLVQEIARLEPPPDIMGYSVPRRNHFCGRWIRSAGWWPDRLVRLFRTGKASMTARSAGAHAVHETWALHGRRDDLRAPLDHFSYASVAEYRRKFALYTGLESRAARVGPASLAVAWLLVAPRLLWYLLRRGGILEGWRGAFVCAGSALYPAVVAGKSMMRRGSGERGASP